MKVRTDFVTNSSSASFVICKKDLPTDKREEIIQYMERFFEHSSVQELNEGCEECDFSNVYHLVDYQPDDEEMHVWVTRDESMNDDFIDEILYNHDRHYDSNFNTKPKFDRHY